MSHFIYGYPKASNKNIDNYDEKNNHVMYCNTDNLYGRYMVLNGF